MTNDLMDKLIDFVYLTTYSKLPDGIKDTAKLAIIDTIGVALAGWHEPNVQILRDTYISRNSEKEKALLWGEKKSLPLEYTALINGTASHVLDFDDVTTTIVAHPSAPIVSAIIPLGECMKKSGEEIITAYAIGSEIMVRLGQVMGFSHYNLGWHATSTMGTLGATAACAYLLGQNREEISNAIAISASMASGLQKNFGTMTKSLHVGLAAQNAIQASLLAHKGFTGNREIFGSRGFFNVFSGIKESEELQKRAEDLEFGNPFDYEVKGLSVKKYPCCYATHRFIQAVLDLREEFDTKIDRVSEINVSVPSGGLVPLIHKRPTTGLQGKFSAEYTCLAAIEDGVINLQTFTDEKVQRSKIQELLSIVKTEEMDGYPTSGSQLFELPVKVSIKMKQGEKYEKYVHHVRGTKDYPMSISEYESKWLDCFSYFLGNSLEDNGPLLQKIKSLFDKALVMENIVDISGWITDINNTITHTNE